MAKKTGSNGAPAPVYARHPSITMVENAISTLKERTGRSAEEWIAEIRTNGPKGARARRDWLKKTHAMGTNYAMWLVDCAEGTGLFNPRIDYDPDGLVEAMFAGKKAHLRPAYDAILKFAFSMGPDVTVTPCSTIVPIRRRYVIAQAKPGTLTRIDLGLALGKHEGKIPSRLIDTGGKAKKDRITHRIEVSTPEDIDDVVKKWMTRAYELDA